MSELIKYMYYFTGVLVSAHNIIQDSTSNSHYITIVILNNVIFLFMLFFLTCFNPLLTLNFNDISVTWEQQHPIVFVPKSSVNYSHNLT